MSRTNLTWLVVYVLYMAGVIWGTCAWREHEVEDLNTPQNIQGWQDFQQKVHDEDKDQTPVRHTVSKRSEPPMLVFLRERFWVILFGAVLFGTIFFGIGMFLIRELWSSTYVPNLPPPDSD
jgi:hypothetical protein